METPLVSIVLIVFNDQKYLKQLIPVIYRNTDYPNFEIIVIDNASSESSKEFLARFYPEIRYYYLPKNLGFGRANNIGIKKSKGKYVQLLNTDTLPQKTWLKYSVEILEKRKDIGMVGCITPGFEESQFKLCYPDKIFFADSATIPGCCMLFPRELVNNDKIGLFDPYIFFFTEDADLSYRFWLQGYRVVVNLSSIVYHYKNLDKISKKNPSFKTEEYLTKFDLYFNFKYYSFFRIIKNILKNWVLFIPLFLNKNGIPKLKAKFKGYLSFIHDLAKVLMITRQFKKTSYRIEIIKKLENKKRQLGYGYFSHVFPDETEYFNELFFKKNYLKILFSLI